MIERVGERERQRESERERERERGRERNLKKNIYSLAFALLERVNYPFFKLCLFKEFYFLQCIYSLRSYKFLDPAAGFTKIGLVYSPTFRVDLKIETGF